MQGQGYGSRFKKGRIGESTSVSPRTQVHRNVRDSQSVRKPSVHAGGSGTLGTETQSVRPVHNVSPVKGPSSSPKSGMNRASSSMTSVKGSGGYIGVPRKTIGTKDAR